MKYIIITLTMLTVVFITGCMSIPEENEDMPDYPMQRGLIDPDDFETDRP